MYIKENTFNREYYTRRRARIAETVKRTRGRPSRKIAPTPDMIRFGFKLRQCFDHGVVLTRSSPRANSKKQRLMVGDISTGADHRICEHHEVTSGHPKIISKYGFEEAGIIVQHLMNEEQQEDANRSEMLRTQQAEANEQTIRLRRRSLRLDNANMGTEDAVREDLIQTIGREPKLDYSANGVVRSLLDIIHAQEQQIQGLQQSTLDMNSQIVDKDEEIAALRDREESGLIRVFNFANAVRYSTVQAATGVSVDVVERFLAPIVRMDCPRMQCVETAVLWYLVYLRTSKTKEAIADEANVSISTLSSKIECVNRALCSRLHDFVRLPSIEEWAESRCAELEQHFPNVLPMSVDATKLPIFQPGDTVASRACWNHKSGGPTLRWFLLVLPNGRIVWRSPVVEGSANDATMYANSSFPMDALAAYPPEGQGNYTLAMFADKGYRSSIAPSNFVLYLTQSAAKSADRDDPDWRKKIEKSVILDTRICAHRFVVERVFGQLKSKWSRLTNGMVYFNQKDFIEKAVGVVCALHNITKWPNVYGDVFSGLKLQYPSN